MLALDLDLALLMVRQVGIQNGAKPVPLEALDFADRMKTLGLKPGDDCTALL